MVTDDFSQTLGDRGFAHVQFGAAETKPLFALSSSAGSRAMSMSSPVRSHTGLRPTVDGVVQGSSTRNRKRLLMGGGLKECPKASFYTKMPTLPNGAKGPTPLYIRYG